MKTVDGVLLLSSGIKIGFVHRGFLFASASFLEAETVYLEPMKLKLQGPSFVRLFQSPARGCSHNFIWSYVFCKICKNSYFVFIFLKDGPKLYKLWALPLPGNSVIWDHFRRNSLRFLNCRSSPTACMRTNLGFKWLGKNFPSLPPVAKLKHATSFTPLYMFLSCYFFSINFSFTPLLRPIVSQLNLRSPSRFP